MNENGKIFDNGIKKAREAVFAYLLGLMRENVAKLLHRAAVNREFHGFTGNTQTSYTGGIYVNGELKDIIYESDYTERPRMKKLKKGQAQFLQNPYEGKARWVRANVNTSDEYGADTAVRFLQSYKPRSHKGISICICTGTEYSEYLEDLRNLDVLTKTFDEAGKILLSSFQPIPNDFM